MDDATPVTIRNRGLRCRHCDHGLFHYRTARLDRTFLGGFLHFEGMWGHATTIYVCARCGCAHLFMEVDGAEHHLGDPSRSQTAPPLDAGVTPDPEPAAGATEPGPVPEEACLACGTIIPPEAAACPKCGWTWEASGGA